MGGAVWVFVGGFGGANGTFWGGMVDSEEGVAGVALVGLGAGEPGPPGPKGISVLTGAAFEELPGRKAGSELKIPSFLSAKVLRCWDN